MERPTEYPTNRTSLSWWRSVCRPLLLCLGTALLGAFPASGQMHFAVSVYNQVSASEDFTTVYGYSSFADSSSGCSHTGYALTTFLVTPDFREFYGTGGYVSAPTDGLVGIYTEAATLQFHCSCVGNVGVGGEDQQCLAHLDHQHRGPAPEQPLASLKRARGADAHASNVSAAKPAEPGREGPRSVTMEVSSVLTLSLPAGATGGRTPNQAGQ